MACQARLSCRTAPPVMAPRSEVRNGLRLLLSPYKKDVDAVFFMLHVIYKGNAVLKKSVIVTEACGPKKVRTEAVGNVRVLGIVGLLYVPTVTPQQVKGSKVIISARKGGRVFCKYG